MRRTQRRGLNGVQPREVLWGRCLQRETAEIQTYAAQICVWTGATRAARLMKKSKTDKQRRKEKTHRRRVFVIWITKSERAARQKVLLSYMLGAPINLRTKTERAIVLRQKRKTPG